MFLFELTREYVGIALTPEIPPGFFTEGSGLVPILSPIVGTTGHVRALSPLPTSMAPNVRAVLEQLRTMLDIMLPT